MPRVFERRYLRLGFGAGAVYLENPVKLEQLLAEGHRVICIDNLETGSLENIAHIRDDRFEFRNIDITERVDIPEDVDFVYHLASPASPKSIWRSDPAYQAGTGPSICCGLWIVLRRKFERSLDLRVAGQKRLQQIRFG